MHKEEFLAQLRRELLDLRPEDRARWLDYYAELIDDAVEDGAGEEEAIASLGTLEELVFRIREETPETASAEPDAAAAIPGREAEGELAFDVSEPFHSLLLETESYDLLVEPALDGRCRVACAKDEFARVEVTVSDGLLRVRQQTLGRPSFRRLLQWEERCITVSLPEGDYRELAVRTLSGDVRVSRRLGFASARLHTKSGDIDFSAAARQLWLESASGDIQLEDIALDALHCRTTSGDARLRQVTVQDTLRLESTSGDAVLQGGAAAVLEVQTVSGDLETLDFLARDHLLVKTVSGDVDMRRFDAGEAQLRTVSGDVRLRLLQGKTYDVSTVSGDKRLPSPVPGAGLFRIATTSGDIQVSVLS